MMYLGYVRAIVPSHGPDDLKQRCFSLWAGGSTATRVRCPSTSVTTSWATSVRASPCCLEPASLKTRTTSSGEERPGAVGWVVGFLKGEAMGEFSAAGRVSQCFSDHGVNGSI